MSPAPATSFEIGRVGRLAVPALVTLALLVAQLLPWTYSGSAMLPSLALMSVFFWSFRLPALFPPVVALLAGAAADLSELTAIGSQTLAFLLVALLARRRTRSASASFLRLWAMFATAALGVNTILWLTEAVFGGHVVPPGQVLARTAVTIAVFPVVAKFILLPAERVARNGVRP